MSSLIHILADANIPFVDKALSELGEVEVRPGQGIGPADVAGAEVLLVRSVTAVDAALLEGSPVRFVGSATIGTDHVDLAYLRDRGIAFAHAPGSNADSVVEYVLAALLAAYAERGEPLRGRTVGVVGCGHIGGRLAERLPHLGVRVLKNDPPLMGAAEATGQPHDFVPLDQVLAEADAVTLHPPLTHAGPHPTAHLVGERELAAMKADALLVNASRGAVVDNRALREALAARRIGGAVLDVWEGEPEPDPALLRLARTATPHVAGYSYDGKVQGTAMLHRALADWLGVTPRWDAEAELTPGPGELAPLRLPDPALPETAWLDALVRHAYDVRADDARMRRLLTLPPEERGAYFHRLRKTYPRRRDFRWYAVADAVPEAYAGAVRRGLRFRLPDGQTS